MISTITLEKVKGYCGVDGNYSDDILETCMTAANSFISSYIGVQNIDDYADLDIAYLVLINDMYNNRLYSIDKNQLNPIVKRILALHSENLI